MRFLNEFKSRRRGGGQKRVVWLAAGAAAIALTRVVGAAVITTYTFVPTTDSNWSTPGNWTASPSGTGPAQGTGNIATQSSATANANIVLDQSYTIGEITQTTGGGYTVTTPNASVLTLSGTAIVAGSQAFGNANVAAIAPQQNSSGTQITINPDVRMATDLDVGGVRAGDRVSIAGSINNATSSTLNLSLRENGNNGTGTSTISGGIGNSQANGTGGIAINNLSTNGFGVTAFTLSGPIGGAQGTAAPVTIANNAVVANGGTNPQTLLISGQLGASVLSITENSALSKMQLNAANSNTGTTTITSGTIDAHVANSLGVASVSVAPTAGKTGTLILDSALAMQAMQSLSVDDTLAGAGAALINLNYSGTDTIASLTYDGTLLPTGSYYSSASANTGGTGESWITGNGVLSVVSSTPEPTSLGLMALGGIGLMARRRRLNRDGRV